MTVRVSKGGLFRLVQGAFLVCAAASFGYCGWEMAASWIFQYRAGGQLEMSLAEPSRALPNLGVAGLVGRMEIPRLEISVVVMEGTTDATLRRAAGHISGTDLPGYPGNVGISAHRDTFFWPLRNIRRDDLVTLTTLSGVFRYRVLTTRIVSPYDVAVLKRGSAEILTLVTCYPFNFIGAAPNRFVVKAKRII
jgi:sortase A